MDERIAALEARIETMEEKRQALRDEVIALRALVTTLLPIIAASGGVPLSAAIDASAIRATRALQFADYSPDGIARVADVLAALREDMGESDDAGEWMPWH